MPINRRDFITTTGTLLAASALAPRAHAWQNEKPQQVALIGSGWYGKVDLLRLIQVAPVEVVALCDVDRNMLSEAAKIVAGRQKSGNTPQQYSDYRKLLAEEELNFVLIDTPDHWHALPMIEACRKGLDVWVQKPISVDIVEGQSMLAAARKYDRVVQVGMQRRSTPHLIDAKQKVIDEGLLGDIGLIEIYCYYHMRSQKNPPNIDPPQNLDYDMWTGPAPMMPYNELIHPRSWRAFMEYCNGIVGDMCVHMLDMVRWMLDLGWPVSVSSNGGILVQTEAKANTTDTQTATFEYPDFPIIWQHRTWGDAPDPDYPWGATIYGSKGTLKLSVNTYDFIPRGNGQKLHGDAVIEFDKYPEDETEQDLERHVASAVRGHMRNFLSCIESREKPVADIEQGLISAASCMLANLALQTDRTLHWDEEAGQISNDAEANKLLAREYRQPWKHPTPDAV